MVNGLDDIGFTTPVRFGGTITHHRMPPNTVAARVAYFWRGKDKPAFWVSIAFISYRRTSYRRASLIGVHLSQACISGVHLRRASWACISHRRASYWHTSYMRASQAAPLTGVRLLQACVSYRRASYRRASLTDVYLAGAWLIGVRLSLSGSSI